MKGIQKIMGLYVDGTLRSFDELRQRYQLPKKHVFRYLQLKIYTSSKHKQIMCQSPLSVLEEITLANIGGKGYVSKYYNILGAHNAKSTPDKFNAWKMDMWENTDEEDWNKACLKARKR